MKRRITTGIDLGTQAIRVVIAEWREGDVYPTVLGTGIAHTVGMRHGYVIHLEEAKKSIAKAVLDAERMAHVKVKSAVVSVGGISLDSIFSSASIAISRTENEVTHADLKRVVAASEKELGAMSNRKIIHVVPVTYKLDGVEILGRATGRTGNKLEVKTLFITCLEQHLQDLLSAVEEVGIEVHDVIAAPVAASLVLLNKKQKVAGCVLVNIGAETMSMIVFENDIPTALHVFPIGGSDITNDIALGLKVTLEEAENIKIGKHGSGYSKRKLDEIVQARLSDIFELVDKELVKINRSGLLPAGVIISGGGAFLNHLEHIAKQSLRIPAHIAHADVQNASKGKLKDSSWSVAYGLTLLEDTEGKPEIKTIETAVKNIKKYVSSVWRELMP